MRRLENFVTMELASVAWIWYFCASVLVLGSMEDRKFNEIDTGVRKFPANFKWGFATASYQIEGGWNLDGKGENIWDTFTHREKSPIDDASTGDVACDSYHKFTEDVQLLKATGADYYRFSLSWTRILPNGTIAIVNQAGINYYNRVIDELIANGIQPMVTLYHWDLPEDLQGIGGWPNEELVTHFADYARLAFASFGDRVKTWITFNEPAVFCLHGYEHGTHAPGIFDPVEVPYLCAHTVLKSHALAYRIYESEFKATQNGKVGITLDLTWYEPGSNAPEDIAASERALQFRHGWFFSPIFYGKYPDVMREYIDMNSRRHGLNTFRLPRFDAGWTFLLKGSYDFLGLNHYTTNMVQNNPEKQQLGWTWDQQTRMYYDPRWEGAASAWLKVVPWGFRSVLNWLKNTYDNPEVYVTENGFSTTPEVGVRDPRRVNYYATYIENMHAAIVEDGCHVTAYTAWSLLDNFEWARGYTERFGVHDVNFSDPERPRAVKDSAKFLTQIYTTSALPHAKKPKFEHERMCKEDF